MAMTPMPRGPNEPLEAYLQRLEDARRYNHSAGRRALIQLVALALGVALVVIIHAVTS